MGPQLLIIRPVHYLPGKKEPAINWAKQTEQTRRACGMVSQMLVQGIPDRGEYLFIQVWESRESYEKWKSSSERAQLVSERQRLVAHDVSKLYEVI